MRKAVKTMLVTGVSYNDLVALERMLLWYTDQSVYLGGIFIAKCQDLGEKIEALHAMSRDAGEMAEINDTLLHSLGVIKTSGDLNEDLRDLSLKLDEGQYAFICNAMNSPFCRLKADHERSFWRSFEGEEVEAKAEKRRFNDLLKALKGATTLVHYEDDEEEVEQGAKFPARDSYATMPSPRGAQ